MSIRARLAAADLALLVEIAERYVRLVDRLQREDCESTGYERVCLRTCVRERGVMP